MGVCGIVIYQDFLKVIMKATLGSYSDGNMKQSKIIRVTESTLDATSVATHQLKNGTVMTWWLSRLSFSVDTVLSVQLHQ